MIHKEKLSCFKVIKDKLIFKEVILLQKLRYSEVTYSVIQSSPKLARVPYGSSQVSLSCCDVYLWILGKKVAQHADVCWPYSTGTGLGKCLLA